MPIKTIEVHYLVCVPIDVDEDENGTTSNPRPSTRPPSIDPEGFIGVDMKGGEGVVWDPAEEVWREPSAEEYLTGRSVIDL